MVVWDSYVGNRDSRFGDIINFLLVCNQIRLWLIILNFT